MVGIYIVKWFGKGIVWRLDGSSSSGSNDIERGGTQVTRGALGIIVIIFVGPVMQKPLSLAHSLLRSHPDLESVSFIIRCLCAFVYLVSRKGVKLENYRPSVDWQLEEVLACIRKEGRKEGSKEASKQASASKREWWNWWSKWLSKKSAQAKSSRVEPM